MKGFAGGIALLALVLCAWAGSQRASAARPPEPRTPSTSSSRLLSRGRVLCTATVLREVDVGHAVSVRFVLRNVSRRPVTVSLGVFGTWLVLRADDGTTYDSRAPDEGIPIPPPFPVKIAPGAVLRAGAQEVPVRWSGPLRITPGCLGKALPAFRVRVTAPGPPADDSAALDDVVAAAGHLLDNCRPQTPGVPVDGQIDDPSGSAPPLNAQCTVSIGSEGSFSVAQVLVVTPPGLAGVQIFQPYETLWPSGTLVSLPTSPPYEAIAWEFVVTRDGAVPVAAASMAASNNDAAQMIPFWEWNGTGFEQNGSSSCGGGGFAWGGTGPTVEFISACPA